nr:hypothetical protein [Fibrella rubiginis]
MPDDSVKFLAVEQLSSGWDEPEATPLGLAEFAAYQFSQHRTLCLAIPSAVVPLSPSPNMLLDPLYKQRVACEIASIRHYPIDPRLPTATLR